MPLIRIEDIADERIAAYRNVKDGDLRRTRGLFMAEGRFVVEQLLGDSRFEAESLFLSERAANAMGMGLERAPDLPIFVAKRAVMNEVVGFDLHRGCLAAGRIGEPLSCKDVLGEAEPSRRETFAVVEGMTNTENLGGVFRNAMAFGVRGVLLCPRSCDPLYRKAIRVSLGASLRLPFARIEDWPAGLADLRDRGTCVVALDPGHDAVPLSQLDRAIGDARRVALLLGTEGSGIGPEALAAADVKLKIPMVEGVDSVNVATAAAIAMQRLHERDLQGRDEAPPADPAARGDSA